MFKKILVANRGEIALRVIRACREIDVPVVAVYSEADRESLHVKLADEAYCIGPAAPSKSYLNIPSIISVAEVAGVDAIHPGYGFLAENPKFAEVCQGNQIKFIGPTAEAMSKMGDKATARAIAKKMGVPVIPGSDGLVKSPEEARKVAARIGYPVVVKASAGGGGRGMRIVRKADELERLYHVAQAEAQAAFNSSALYVEKFIEEPRHVEIQLLADSRKNIIYLGERDCSVQRRHQKLIEEAPSPAVNVALRRRMGEAAVRLARAVHYVSAGTVEFLLDKHGHFYFMEMNTRIQVEHPVTEMVTSVDIVKEQIYIAAGSSLSLRQSDVAIRGHSIECRINAENDERDFMPSPGDITLYLPPGGPGVRVDSHIYEGYSVLPHYDSLIAKLIVWGRDRDEAIARMLRALDEYVISGVFTTIPFHQKVLKNKYFKEGKVYTDFIAKHILPEQIKREGA